MAYHVKTPLFSTRGPDCPPGLFLSTQLVYTPAVHGPEVVQHPTYPGAP